MRHLTRLLPLAALLLSLTGCMVFQSNDAEQFGTFPPPELGQRPAADRVPVVFDTSSVTTKLSRS